MYLVVPLTQVLKVIDNLECSVTRLPELYRFLSLRKMNRTPGLLTPVRAPLPCPVTSHCKEEPIELTK